MNRVANWHIHLYEVGQEVVGQPFEWGITDCVTIARKCIKAMYGEDLTEPYINSTYTTAVGAVRAYRKTGLYGELLEKVGAVVIPSNLSRDGDIMVFDKTDADKFQNVMTKIGGAWILADPQSKKIIPIKVYPSSIGDDAKVYRIV